MFNRSVPPVLEQTVWEVVVKPTSRPGLVDRLRPDLESHLAKRPEARAFSWDTPLGIVEVRLASGTYRQGSPIRFSFATQTAATGKNGAGAKSDVPMPMIGLPDDRISKKTDNLVGLDGAIGEILVHFRCRWDGELERPQRNIAAIPAQVHRHFQGTSCLFVLAGRPGTGKTVSAEGAANLYCKENGIAGTLIKVTTAVRGQGLVGQFSQQIHEAFETALRLPQDELKVLQIDEADTLAVRRSIEQAHQEDRAATASILQAVDAAAGVYRFAVVMTTNMLDDLDPALLRRATVIGFCLPSREDRAVLLKRWLDPIEGRQLRKAVKATENMTGADIERALARAWLLALSAGVALDTSTAIRWLASAERTDDV